MKLRSLILIALVPAVLTSCLKSRDSVGVVADNGSVTTGIFDRFFYGELKAIALNALPLQETIPDFLSIRMSAPRKKAGTVHVKLAIDNSMVTAYNLANGTSFVVLPTNAYTLPTGLEFDIPSSNYQIFDFPLNLDKSALNLQNVYAIGFKLVSVSEGAIDALQASIIVSILVKNQYHGSYISNGYLYHPSAPRDIIDLPKNLVTTGPYSVTADLGDLGTSGYKATFTVDPATNNVTIVTAPGGAGGPYTMFTSGLPSTFPGYTPAWPGSAQCNNTYDPATRTFKVRYGYLNASTGWRVTEELIVRQ